MRSTISEVKEIGRFRACEFSTQRHPILPIGAETLPRAAPIYAALIYAARLGWVAGAAVRALRGGSRDARGAGFGGFACAARVPVHGG